MSDPYMSFGPDPSHEQGSRYLTVDQIWGRETSKKRASLIKVSILATRSPRSS